MAKWPKDTPGSWYSHYKRGSLVSGTPQVLEARLWLGISGPEALHGSGTGLLSGTWLVVVVSLRCMVKCSARAQLTHSTTAQVSASQSRGKDRWGKQTHLCHGDGFFLIVQCSKKFERVQWKFSRKGYEGNSMNFRMYCLPVLPWESLTVNASTQPSFRVGEHHLEVIECLDMIPVKSKHIYTFF